MVNEKNKVIDEATPQKEVDSKEEEEHKYVLLPPYKPHVPFP